MSGPIWAATIPAAAHGGTLRPAFHVIHSTEGPMSDGNARALASWFARTKANGGPGTSATDIFDPTEGVRMLPDNVVAYHVGPAGNGISTGSEHCGSVNLTAEQWLSDRGKAMLDRSARASAERAHARGWSIAACRWLSLTEVARRNVPGFCTHNDVRLALGGTTHSDPGPNFPYAWYMGRVRAWYVDPTNGGDDVSVADVEQALKNVLHIDDLAVPKGQASNNQLAVLLVGASQQEFNANGQIKAALGQLQTALSAVEEDTTVTGDDEAAIKARIDSAVIEIKAAISALPQTPGA